MPESPLRQHLDLERDEIMCDRGFNRAEDYIRLHSPKSIGKGQSQMSVSNCNYTRCVTRLRQVIERLFGRLKHWKLIYNVVDTAYIPMIRPIFLSLCCMDNMFFPPLFQDKPENDDGDIIRLLISLHQAENHVKETINQWGNNVWKKLPVNQIAQIFPVVDSLESIRIWNTGPYALKLAEEYEKHNDQSIVLRFDSKCFVHKSQGNPLSISEEEAPGLF